MNKLCNALVVLMLLLAGNASADTLRFASGYPSTSQVDGRPYIGSYEGINFTTTWEIVGIEVTVATRTQLTSVAGVGGHLGLGNPMSGMPYIAVHSSTESFRLSNRNGDVYTGSSMFGDIQEFSVEGFPARENYRIELLPTAPIVLKPGTYVISAWLKFGGGRSWGWAFSTSDLGTDFFVDSVDDSLFLLDDFSDTGTVAVDIFGTPIPDGDYDFDGDVDGADYLKWQSTYGSTTDLDADGNGDNIVDAADYTVWRDNYGSPAFTATASAIVPEPSGVFLAATCFALLGSSRIRRRKELLR